MKKFIAAFMLCMSVFGVADAASRVSSRPSFTSSRSSYSAPKMSTPRTSNQGLKALGFTKPASGGTALKANVGGSYKSTSTTSSTFGGWWGKKGVSSTPVTTSSPVITRKVSSPVSYVNSKPVRNVTVVQRNYYGGGYGYNYGYRAPVYGGYYGYSTTDHLLGTMTNVMLINAIMGSHHSGSSGASAWQIEQAKSDQRIEDKLDFQNQLLLQQNQNPVTVAPQTAAKQPECYLPPDAPLMMNPNFYCANKGDVK